MQASRRPFDRSPLNVSPAADERLSVSATEMTWMSVRPCRLQAHSEIEIATPA